MNFGNANVQVRLDYSKVDQDLRALQTKLNQTRAIPTPITGPPSSSVPNPRMTAGVYGKSSGAASGPTADVLAAIARLKESIDRISLAWDNAAQAATTLASSRYTAMARVVRPAPLELPSSSVRALPAPGAPGASGGIGGLLSSVPSILANLTGAGGAVAKVMSTISDGLSIVAARVPYVGKLFSGLFDAIGRISAAAHAVGRAFMLGFNLIGGAIRAVEVGFGRMMAATQLLRTTLSGAASIIAYPFKLGLQSLGLFNAQAGVLGSTFGALGNAAKSLGARITGAFSAAIGRVKSFFSEMTSSMAGGGSGGGFGGGMMGPLAGLASGAGMFASVKAASDLNEQVSKSGQIFKTAQGPALAFADQMASKFGLVKTQVVDSQAAFGLFFNNIGKGAAESQQMSSAMVKLAADMSSFYNVSTEEATRALMSGLAGESMPLRRFGVFLDDDTIKARALALGLADSTGELSRAAKMQATYSLILSGTTSAQGDLERTSGSFANLMRAAWGRMQNAAAEFGKRLLPVGQALMGLVNDLLSGGSGIVSSFSSMLGGVVDVVAARLADAITFVRKAIIAWPEAMSLVQVGLQIAAQNTASFFSWLATQAGKVMGGVGTVLGTVLPAVFQGLGPVLLDLGRSMVATIFEGLSRAVAWLAEQAGGIIGNFSESGKKGLMSYAQDIRTTGAWAANGIRGDQSGKTDFAAIGSAIGTAMKNLPQLDAFHLQIDPAQQAKLDELLNKINTVKLPGEGAEGGPRGVVMPDGAPIPGDETKAASKKREGGQFLDIAAMLGQLQQSVFSEDSKNAKRTANATEGVNAKMGKLLDRAGRPTVAVMG